MLTDQGCHVDVIALRPATGQSPTELHGVRLWEVPLIRQRGGLLRYIYQYTMFMILSTVLLVRLHARRRFQVVHVHSLPDFQVFCAFPLWLGQVPVLLDLHEAMPEILEARFQVSGGAIIARAAAVLESLSCRFANRIVVANDGIREAIVSRGISPSKVTTIYNAAEVPGNPGAAEVVLRKLGIPRGRMIVHAGGINAERDLPTLFRALSCLPARDKLQVVLAGEGDGCYVEELRALAASLGMLERVHFVGQLPREWAFALMSLSELGVVTLQSNPLTDIAWPTRLAEYAVLGKPLIVPRLRFIESQLNDSARYYTPGDAESLRRAFEECLLGGSITEALAEKARRIGQRFSVEVTRSALVGLYITMGANLAQ